MTTAHGSHPQTRPWVVRKPGIALSGFESLLYGISAGIFPVRLGERAEGGQAG